MRALLQKIKNDDWFYLGTGILENNVSFLTNVQSDDLYYLGKGIIERNKEYLDKISQ